MATSTRTTQKQIKAQECARDHDLPPYEDKDILYRKLNDEGWFWDNKKKEWVNFANEPADEPTPLIMIRVWAANENLKEAVETVCSAFGNGFGKVLESDPYPCRPPKQLESRVYLQFKRMPEMTKAELIIESDPSAIEIEG